jgi:hypothetical protein
MSVLSDKINWACEQALKNVESGQSPINPLMYITKIYPKGRIPAWAREKIDPKVIAWLKESDKTPNKLKSELGIKDV